MSALLSCPRPSPWVSFCIRTGPLLFVALLEHGLVQAEPLSDTSALQAQDIPGVSQADSRDALLLQQAGALLAAGQTEQARALVTLLRNRPQPHLEALFLSGMLYAGAAAYDQAATEFRLMLTRDPTLVRPRLELARVLFLAKDYDGARYHFEQVLAAGIPDDVRPAVLGYLTAIRERVPTFSMSMDLVSDTNPAQATSSKTVILAGRAYQLSNVAPGKTVWGMAISANGRLPSPLDPSVFLRFAVDAADYPSRANDVASALLYIGRNITLDDQTLTVEGGIHHTDYQQRKLYSGPAWRVADFIRASDKLSWQVALDNRSLRYENYSYLDGWQRTLSVDGIYAASPQTRLQFGVSYLNDRAYEPAYSFRTPAVYGRISHEWDGGLITGIRVQRSQSDYWGADPFFGQVRADKDNRVEIDLINRNWQIFELSPRLLLGVVDHPSNISLYSFRRKYVHLGVSREF